MKFITLFYTQYPSDEATFWDPINATVATDFVFIPPAYSSTYPSRYASDTINKIDQLVDARIKNNKPVNIWISTPGIDSTNFASGYTSANLTKFLSTVYSGLKDTSKSKVAGAYMNQESFYGGMDYNNLLNGSKPANKQLKIMAAVRDFVKGGAIGGKELLWIPYYGVGDDAARIIKDLGHAADKLQIFDYCIMQPGYLRNPTGSKGNFEGIRISMQKGKVCCRDGVPVIASKVSTTKLGFEMEYEPRYAQNYQSYIDAFASDRNKYPYGFYWAGTPATVFPNIINQFMLYGTQA